MATVSQPPMATHLTSSRDPRVKEVHASSFRLGREVCKPHTCLRTRAEGWAHKYRSPKTYFESSPSLPPRFRQPSSKMTQASTSAANFGLLLVALILMLHSAVGELTPRRVSHHLFARQDISDQCFLTKLAPNNKEYETSCGDKSDSKHPCFTGECRLKLQIAFIFPIPRSRCNSPTICAAAAIES